MSTSPYPPAEVVIGLDVGTTGTKAVAFGLGSGWRHTVVREYPLLAPNPGWQVQDPATVVAAVMGALAEVVTAARGARIVGISVSTAMHGLIGAPGGGPRGRGPGGARGAPPPRPRPSTRSRAHPSTR